MRTSEIIDPEMPSLAEIRAECQREIIENEEMPSLAEIRAECQKEIIEAHDENRLNQPLVLVSIKTEANPEYLPELVAKTEKGRRKISKNVDTIILDDSDNEIFNEPEIEKIPLHKKLKPRL